MNYYKTLGITENSSQEEIKKAFHELAHRYHPDKGGDEKKMKEINEAYEILSKIKKSISLQNIYRQNAYRDKEYHQTVYHEGKLKCKVCGQATDYSLCLDCWIMAMKEKKIVKMHKLRSLLYCYNCDKSLYHRSLNRKFCDSKCSTEYHKKNKLTRVQREGLYKKQEEKLKVLNFEKLVDVDRDERISAFSKIVGKEMARWFNFLFEEKLVKRYIKETYKFIEKRDLQDFINKHKK